MDEVPENLYEQPQEPSTGALHEDEPISAIVIHEAAAAIEAVGRELALGQTNSLREFLRGPAVRVGVAVSVLGATLWIQELIVQHQARARRTAASMGRSHRARRKSTARSST
jgi:hypothetical protein